jgi:hypothetical protein
MFSNFFSFQSKNKEGKSNKDENGKKSKSKKGKEKNDRKEEKDHLETELLKDEEEQFEDVGGPTTTTTTSASNIDLDNHDTATTISNDISGEETFIVITSQRYRHA